MKIKLKNKDVTLPNCWKSCGTTKEDWAELQKGKEIDVEKIGDGIKFLVESAKKVAVPAKKKESK